MGLADETFVEPAHGIRVTEAIELKISAPNADIKTTVCQFFRWPSVHLQVTKQGIDFQRNFANGPPRAAMASTRFEISGSSIRGGA